MPEVGHRESEPIERLRITMPYKNNLKINECAATADSNENAQELLNAVISFVIAEVLADREDRRKDLPRTDKDSADYSDANGDRGKIGRLMLDAPRCACNHGRQHGGAHCIGFFRPRRQ